MSRVASVFEDLGVGVVALITAVLALAVGIVATLYLTGGTPYSQEDLDRATTSYELRSESPETEDETAAPAVVRDAEAIQQELDEARERAERLQRESDTFEEELATAKEEVRRLRKALAQLLKDQKGDKPGGAAGDGEEPDEDATEVVASGTLVTTWVLSSEAKPWPGACGIPGDTYQVNVVGKDGKTVTTAPITSIDMVERKDKAGVLTLVCELGYEATVPLPLQAAFEFQAVAKDQPTVPLYTAMTQGSFVKSGTAPDLTVSLTR